MRHFLLVATACAGLLTAPAFGEGLPKPTLVPLGKTPVPPGTFTPGKPPPIVPGILTGATAQPTTALAEIIGLATPDQGTRLSWSEKRADELDVKVGDTFDLAYLTRGKPAYDRVKLQFVEGTGQLDLGSGCGDLAEKHLATIDGQIKAEPAIDDLVNTVLIPKNKLDGKGDIFLVHVSAAFNEDLLAAAKLKKKAAVRAFPVDSQGTCLQKSAGAFLATLVDKATMPKVTVHVPPPAPPAPPHVSVNWDVVGYYPQNDDAGECYYIITGKVTDPTWKAVLQAADTPTAVGTHFALCEGDFHRLYDELPTSKKIGISLKDALAELAHAYNWTTSEFQKLAEELAGPASALLGKKFGLIATESLMGALPGSPLTGDLNMVADQGCDYLKQQVAGKMASEQSSDKLSSEQQKQSDDAVQQVCNLVKKQLQERGRPNDFLVHDPDHQPHAPVAFLRVKYSAFNNPPPDTLSKPYPVAIIAQSRGGPGPISPGGAPQAVLLKRDVSIPPGKAGTSVVMPFSLDYAIPPMSTAFADSGRSKFGVKLFADQSILYLDSIIARVEPPAK